MCRNHSHVTIVAAEGVEAGPLRFFIVEMAQPLMLESSGGIKTELPRGRFLYFMPLDPDGSHPSVDLLRVVGLTIAEMMSPIAEQVDGEARDNMSWIGGA